MTTINTFDDARSALAAGMTPDEAAKLLLASMTPEERLWCLDGDLPAFTGLGFVAGEDGYHRAPFIAGRIERVGLAGLAFSDGPRGCVIGNATCFPVSMARGATWDPDLEERVGEAMGAELAASGANLTGAVCVNVLRHPAWGRTQETYGEDPFHVGELGAALTRGLQRHVMACVKHFAVNSMENARFSVDVQVDEVALHEVYLPHFRRIVDEGVASVMSAYNMMNGQWCGESHHLLTEILRDEWGFEGYVISDWVFGLRDAARSLAGGLDIEMPARMVRYEHLTRALEDGTANWDDVDRSVVRLISTLLRFDDVLSNPAPAQVIGSSSHRELAREVAARSVVLLRNEPVEHLPVLPLDPTTSLAVIGRLADRVNVGDAGSSDVWDLSCVTVREGLVDAMATTTYDDGTDPQRAAAMAALADAAIVVVGYTEHHEGEFMGDMTTLPNEVFPSSEEPGLVESFSTWRDTIPDVARPERIGTKNVAFGAGGDRTSLRLLDADVELIRAVAAANPRTIVAIQAGSAVVCNEWAHDVPAIVQSWYAGAQAGPGLADVLTGVVNPSGRLPFSVPSHEAHLPPFDRDATSVVYGRWHGWWHLQREGYAAAFPFGWGLSYSTIVLDNSAEFVIDGADIVISGAIHNTGERDGAEVVQVYAELPDPEAPDRLAGFVRIEVGAGATERFEIRVPRQRLESRDASTKSWVAPRGEYQFRIARHAQDQTGPTGTITL